MPVNDLARLFHESKRAGGVVRGQQATAGCRRVATGELECACRV